MIAAGIHANHILVVDDEPHVRDLITRWLRGAGYNCTGASGVQSAWERLQQNPFDLVSLDIRLPDGSGLELLDRLREAHPDVAVLMSTGEGEASKAIHALTHGAFGYLAKPIRRDELLAQVAIGLERRRLVLENRSYLHKLESMVRDQTQKIRAAHEETIHRLMTVSMFRDEETGAHIRRTGLYSEQLAAAAGWNREAVDQIRLAAPMHDIGKVGIADAILRKPGKLTKEEMDLMKTHTLLGGQMLSGTDTPVLVMAREIALYHHERWDGAGYPFGLREEKIPESARILAVVDVFDALSHARVYRPKLPREEVLKMLKEGRGTHFDPRLLDLFLSLLPEMYAIAETVLDDDERFGQPCSLDIECWTETAPQAAAPLRGAPSGRPLEMTVIPGL